MKTSGKEMEPYGRDHPYELVEKATSSGRWLRSSWHGVLESKDLKTGWPRDLKILGEELVIYRDREGRPRILEGRCAHRRAKLSIGKVEGDGIRCAYHGWLYDGTGQCIAQPTEQDGGGFARKVKLNSYAAKEKAGFIWLYMGEGDPPPLRIPEELISSNTIEVRHIPVPCNWFQYLENSLDPTHAPHLHAENRPPAHTGERPRLETELTEWGFQMTSSNHGKEKSSGIQHSYRFYPPNMTLIKLKWTNVVSWFIPVDDLHTRKYLVYCNTFSPWKLFTFRLWGKHLRARRQNKVNAQDVMALLAQGPLVEREKESLGSADLGVITLRKICAERIGRQLEKDQNGGAFERERQIPGFINVD